MNESAQVEGRPAAPRLKINFQSVRAPRVTDSSDVRLFIEALQQMKSGAYIEAAEALSPLYWEPGAMFFASLGFTAGGEYERARELLAAITQGLSLPGDLITKSEVDAQFVIALTEFAWLPLAIDTSYSAALFLFALVLESQNEIANSASILRQMVDLGRDIDSADPEGSNWMAASWGIAPLADLLNLHSQWAEVVELTNGYTAATDPFAACILLARAEAMLQMGLPDAALAVCKEVRRYEGTDLARQFCSEEGLHLQARYIGAAAYLKAGKHRQAHKELEEIYALNPRFRDVSTQLGAS